MKFESGRYVPVFYQFPDEADVGDEIRDFVDRVIISQRFKCPHCDNNLYVTIEHHYKGRSTRWWIRCPHCTKESDVR